MNILEKTGGIEQEVETVPVETDKKE